MALTARELQTFDDLVGQTSSIVASGIARLHLASPDPKKQNKKYRDADSILNQFPHLSNSEWTSADVMGGLLLVIDRAMGTVIFQIYNVDTNELRFEYELYEDIEYTQLNDRFHCFEMEDCVAGFHFSSVEVASKFYNKVAALKPVSPDSEAKKKKKGGGLFGRNRKSKKKKTKGIEIGEVQFVKHEAHIGVDQQGGFDLSQIPPEWKELFRNAGVRKKDLKNPETAKALVEAIQSQQMTMQYQAMPEYQNYTEEDLERMYTPEHRAQFEAYQEEMRRYETEIEQFRSEQAALDQWQRENAALLKQYQVDPSVPVAPPREGRREAAQAPVAPPRIDRREQQKIVAEETYSTTVAQPISAEPVKENDFAAQLREKGQGLKRAEVKKAPPPMPVRETREVQENTFNSELEQATKRRQKTSVNDDIDVKISAQKKERETQAAGKHKEPKYDMKKLNALEKKKSEPVIEPMTATERIKANIYERSVVEEDSKFESVTPLEPAPKSPEVLKYEQAMEKAKTDAEIKSLEAARLQAERDRIMQTIKELEERRKKTEKDMETKKESVKENLPEIILPPLPEKPTLPPPPKLPALPKLDIPLPPPPPSKPTFELPPPPPTPAKPILEMPPPPPQPVLPKEQPSASKVEITPGGVKETVVVEVPKIQPPKQEPPKPKPVPEPVKPPVNPAPEEQRKLSVTPLIVAKPPEPENKPPGMAMPSDLMMGIMKGAPLKNAAPAPPPPAAPKTVKPPPNLMLQAIASGEGRKNLKKTVAESKKKASARVSAKALPDLRRIQNGKVEGLLMAKLAETIKERRNHMGNASDDDEEDSDWSMD